MSEDEIRQTIVDQEHLKLLSIGYLISGCLDAFFSLLGLFYIFMGVFLSRVIARAGAANMQGPPPEFVAWIFGFLGVAILLIMMASFVLKVLVYQRLRQRRSRIFCMVVAGLTCIWIPFGTLLGVLTFLVLARSSVIRLFEETDAAGQGDSGVGA
ncbi:MAG TPA: hypothetical protein VFW45_03680 [Candidatus Polarisedimenticolia bacterium]|nr:hypothetical protein [Candidatus Polarisedimenticolia bacterium]